MRCTACGQECFDETYPQVVFQGNGKLICEECSIDYEEISEKGAWIKVQFRQDLIEQGFVEQFSK